MTSEKYAQGVATFNKIHGGLTAEKTIKDLEAISPELARFSLEWIFGDIYSRKQLSVKNREIANIAALVMHGNAFPQLENHIHAGLKVGCSQAEILEIILQMSIIAGFPSCVNAMLVAKKIFLENNQHKENLEENSLIAQADKACFDQGKYDEAMALYNQQLQIKPDDSLALSRRGNIFRFWGNLKSALFDINASLELDADNQYAYLTKIRILLAMNDKAAATNLYQNLADTHTLDIRVLQQRAAAQSALGLHQEALDTCIYILNSRPEDAATWYTQGVVLSAMNQPAAAIASFDKALFYRPEHTDTILRRNSLLNLITSRDEEISNE